MIDIEHELIGLLEHVSNVEKYCEVYLPKKYKEEVLEHLDDAGTAIVEARLKAVQYGKTDF